MEAFFLHLCNISITASWLILAVIALRFFLQKAPKWIFSILWSFVGLRLILPSSFESILSLIPSTKTFPEDMIMTNTPMINSGIPTINAAINPILSSSLAPDPADSVNPMQVISFAASIIWIVGMIGMIVYMVISYLYIRHKVREAVFENGVWLCDHIEGAFILGVFRPRIYIPSHMNVSDIPFVLSHEKAHIKRFDHLWKPFGFLLLTIYWFNPMIWIAYSLLCRDIEYACDEKVLKEMGYENKTLYSHALINASISKKHLSACPLAFGEISVKSRIKHVLHYKKPAFWLILIALIACIAVAVCFLADPISDKNERIPPSLPRHESEMEWVSVQDPNKSSLIGYSFDLLFDFEEVLGYSVKAYCKGGNIVFYQSSDTGSRNLMEWLPHDSQSLFTEQSTIEFHVSDGETEIGTGQLQFKLLNTEQKNDPSAELPTVYATYQIKLISDVFAFSTNFDTTRYHAAICMTEPHPVDPPADFDVEWTLYPAISASYGRFMNFSVESDDYAYIEVECDNGSIYTGRERLQKATIEHGESFGWDPYDKKGKLVQNAVLSLRIYRKSENPSRIEYTQAKIQLTQSKENEHTYYATYLNSNAYTLISAEDRFLGYIIKKKD